ARAGRVRAPDRERLSAPRASSAAGGEVPAGTDDGHAAPGRDLRGAPPAVRPLRPDGDLAVGEPVGGDGLPLQREHRGGGALGRDGGVVVVAALVGYVLLKYVRRRLFLRGLRIARISPEDLRRKLDAGEDVAILDLRTALDVAATPYAIPGSRWIPAEAIDE